MITPDGYLSFKAAAPDKKECFELEFELAGRLSTDDCTVKVCAGVCTLVGAPDLAARWTTQFGT